MAAPLRPIVRGGPKLKPQEATQRASKIAVDMCTMNLQFLSTVSQFLPMGELFHLQMQLLYGLIDTMGATANVDPLTVLGMCTKYFEALQRERNEMEELPQCVE